MAHSACRFFHIFNETSSNFLKHPAALKTLKISKNAIENYDVAPEVPFKAMNQASPLSHCFQGINEDAIIFSVNLTDCYCFLVFYDSCHEALRRNAAQEGYFPIKHRGMMRNVVPKCVQHGNDVTAEFEHDSEKIMDVNGYESCGSYR